MTVHPNDIIVRFGDIGDRFYITLKGRYAVWVPVLHFHILNYLEKALSVIDSEDDNKRKLKAIRVMKFQFKHHHMAHKPEKPLTPLPQYKGTEQDMEESDLDKYLPTSGDEANQSNNNNHFEDEIVVYVLRKCIQILKENGVNSKSLIKDQNWSISPETFDIDKPVQLRMGQIEDFWKEFIRLSVQKTDVEP